MKNEPICSEHDGHDCGHEWGCGDLHERDARIAELEAEVGRLQLALRIAELEVTDPMAAIMLIERELRTPTPEGSDG